MTTAAARQRRHRKRTNAGKIVLAIEVDETRLVGSQGCTPGLG
jgi:hypothetical protein